MKRNKRDGDFRIAQWSFWVSGEGSVKVPVYLVLPTRDDGAKPTYKAVILHDPSANRTRDTCGKTIIEGDNLRVLEQDVDNALSGMVEIEWEHWIRVCAKSGMFGADWNGADVGFDASPIQLGTKPDGKKCWRRSETDSITAGVPQGSRHGDDDDFSWVYVLDTPENRKILTAFAAGFTATAHKLDKFLHRDDMLERLAEMSGKLLPMSKPPTAKKKMKRTIRRRTRR